MLSIALSLLTCVVLTMLRITKGNFLEDVLADAGRTSFAVPNRSSLDCFPIFHAK